MFTQEHGSFPITYTKNSIVIIVDYTSHAMFCQALLYDLFVILSFLFISFFFAPAIEEQDFCEKVLNKYPFGDIIKTTWNPDTLHNKHNHFFSQER